MTRKYISVEFGKWHPGNVANVAAQMYELVTRKIPQIVWAESGSYFIAD